MIPKTQPPHLNTIHTKHPVLSLYTGHYHLITSVIHGYYQTSIDIRAAALLTLYKFRTYIFLRTRSHVRVSHW